MVAVGHAHQRGERVPPSVDHTVTLRARFAAARRAGAGEVAPILARTLPLSRLARNQSIWSAMPRRSSSVRCGAH